MDSSLWRIGTMPNPTADDQSAYVLTPEQQKTVETVCLYLEDTGEISRPEDLGYGEEYWDRQPVTVYVGHDGTYAGAEGVLISWANPEGTMFRGWVRADGGIGRVEKDVVVREPDPNDEDDDGESFWQRSLTRMVELRTATGFVGRPFM